MPVVLGVLEYLNNKAYYRVPILKISIPTFIRENIINFEPTTKSCKQVPLVGIGKGL